MCERLGVCDVEMCQWSLAKAFIQPKLSHVIRYPIRARTDGDASHRRHIRFSLDGWIYWTISIYVVALSLTISFSLSLSMSSSLALPLTIDWMGRHTLQSTHTLGYIHLAGRLLGVMPCRMPFGHLYYVIGYIETNRYSIHKRFLQDNDGWDEMENGRAGIEASNYILVYLWIISMAHQYHHHIPCNTYIYQRAKGAFNLIYTYKSTICCANVLTKWIRITGGAETLDG